MSRFKNNLLPAILTILLPCACSLAQTQGEMNEEACRQYQQADTELNQVYKQILSEYQSQAAFIAKLKAAQRAWLEFRDAHLESLYPEQEKLGQYGSVFPMCRCMVLEDLTKERTKVLRKWIRGIQEGDLCAGSIRSTADNLMREQRGIQCPI